MKKIIIVLSLAILLYACRAPVAETPSPVASPSPTLKPTPERSDTATILEQLGGQPCPESDFTCVNLTVPLDHFHPENGLTLEVVFAVLPASGERRGMFVTATGGPGSAGISSADSYTAAMPPQIPEHFDIVFFDQRGVGLSGGLQCTQAAAAFYTAPWETATRAQETDFLLTSRTFAQDCVDELRNSSWLPYLGTLQAVEDLDGFRGAMGDEKFWLYGESYGTQYAQTYAAAHPDRLAGLILDGTVDLTLDGDEFLDQQAQAFYDVLQMTLQACNEDEYCAEDFGGDAVAAFDSIASQLARSPVAFSFPLANGSREERWFTYSDLETAASSYLYSEGARHLLLRALAYAYRYDNFVPLARVLYESLMIDPETQEAVADPSYSDAIYYAVECQDYAYFLGAPDARARAYLLAGDEVENRLPYFSSVFYGDLPCVYWEAQPDEVSRPEPLIAPGIPTLVLGATADPATPVGNGVSIYQRLADGYLVTEQGGPHIIFGWGNECVDNLVADFLTLGKMPVQRETVCGGVVTDLYIPIAPAVASDYIDALDIMSAIEAEIYYLPDYFFWDYLEPINVGCPYGGSLTIEATDESDVLTLNSCAISDGLLITGFGGYDYESGSITLDVAIAGLKQGNLKYISQADGNIRLTGTYEGEMVAIDE